MNIFEQLFPTLAELGRFAPLNDISATISDLQASARTALRRMEIMLSGGVVQAIASDESGSDEALSLIDAEKTALANLTLANQMIFDSVNRRKAGTDVYKYEVEGMQRAYKENYFNGMDRLILLLETGASGDPEAGTPYALWKESRYRGMLNTCQIKSADEFDMIIPIDLSYIYFFRTLPIQREVLDEGLSVYFNNLAGIDSDELVAKLTPMLRLVLAKRVVARSLRRFDIMGFPPTLRNLLDDSTASRNGKDEREAAVLQASQLEAESKTLLDTVDMLLDEGTTDYTSFSAFNSPTDKIVMAP